MQRRVNSIRESNNPRMARHAPKTVRKSIFEEEEIEDENEEVEIEDEELEPENNDSALKDQIIELVRAAVEDGIVTAEDLGFSSGDEEDEGDEDYNPMEEAARKVLNKRIQEHRMRAKNREAKIAEAKERIRARSGNRVIAENRFRNPTNGRRVR